MADRYFIITGTGRIGTQWLAGMLSQCPGCICPWEPFNSATWGTGLQEWSALDAEVVGMASVHARHLVKEITEIAEPVWIFGWRDPLETVWSVMQRHARHGWSVRTAAPWVFGVTESALQMCMEACATVGQASFADYTKPEGFADLAKSLGLEVPDGIKYLEPQNTTKQYLQERPGLSVVRPPSEWRDAERAYVWDVVRSFPLVAAAYASLDIKEAPDAD